MFVYLPLVWLYVGITALVIYVIFPIASLNFKKVSQKLGFNQGQLLNLIYLIGEIITVIIIFYIVKENGFTLEYLGFSGKLSLTAVSYAIGGFILSFALFPIVDVINKKFGWGMYWKKWEVKNFAENLKTKRNLILMIIMWPILFAPLEEMIFRGFALHLLLENLNNLFLVYIFSSLIFAIAHCFIGPGAMLYIFLGTFIISFIYITFNSIYPCILMHSLCNLIGGIIVPLIEERWSK